MHPRKRIAREKPDAETSPAGRTFTFNERVETQVANTMRDVDEMLNAARRLYPGARRWTRAEFIQMFFLDSATSQLQELLDRDAED